MICWICGCEKWIPDKILHRNDAPIFSQLLFFCRKKIILKMKKIFFRKFWKTYFFENFSKENLIFPFEKIYFGKIWFFHFFAEKNIFSFSKLFFSTKKWKLRKKLTHHFDVEFCQESIFRTPEAIRQLLRELWVMTEICHLICSSKGGFQIDFVDLLYSSHRLKSAGRLKSKWQKISQMADLSGWPT